MAMPQYPIAQPGSFVVIAVNDFSASSYQNECRSATARSKSSWTAGTHETGKWTRPSFSPSWADATEPPASNSMMIETTSKRAFMIWSSFSACMRRPVGSLVGIETERQAPGVSPLPGATQGVVARALHVAEQPLEPGASKEPGATGHLHRSLGRAQRGPSRQRAPDHH